MSLPRTSLRTFLASAKTALNTAVHQSNSPPVTFVIGNESADLDSLCSALLLAYMRTYTSTSGTIHIPLSNLQRSDLSLRPELLPVLSHANIHPNDLLTLSDLPASTALPPQRTRWLLVDHNALQGALGAVYGSRVIGCVDHHAEEHAVPQGSDPRVVQPSGSCASLVVEYCRAAWEAEAETTGKLKSDSVQSDWIRDRAAWDSQMARVGLGPILIDTANLTMKDKVTTEDTEAIGYLEAKIRDIDGEKYEREAFYEQVKKAKEDIGSLSLRDILRKDYKEWTEGDGEEEEGSASSVDGKVGISSVVKAMSFLLDKAGSEAALFDEIRAFGEERGLQVCAVMTTFTRDGTFGRELMVWGFGKDGVEVVRRFESGAGQELGLNLLYDGKLDLDSDEQSRRCWVQGKLEASRKQVGPLLRKAMHE